jgi:uncharacterized protein (TIGR02996 family)
MSDGAALLSAIIANPDEDAPRLVFADWLDEWGGRTNAARAEHIRLQVALHRLAPPRPIRDTHPEVLAARAAFATGVTIPDRWAGLSAADRDRVVHLDARWGAVWAAFGLHVLLGLSQLDCAFAGNRTLTPYEFDQRNVRRGGARVLTVDDLYHGMRRGFLGALACASGFWEAEAEALTRRAPIEEVEFTDIPRHTPEWYSERWPHIRFNPR